jgi:hypothetical protein
MDPSGLSDAIEHGWQTILGELPTLLRQLPAYIRIDLHDLSALILR